ncbi:hypothetical protein [Aquabacterium sp.]|uniref:hypothetical protein n=1 Tax=Aquabacterium sp. TaxID=1872578 RepID=UPI003785106E
MPLYLVTCQHRSARRRVPRPLGLALLAVSLVAACGPALDWREMRPEGTHVRVAMPCRPASHERQVPLAGTPVTMRLLACPVGSATFALAYADVADPARVAPALSALVEAARANVQGQGQVLVPAQVPGMTPQPQAQRWRMQGRLPDGRAIVSQGLVFAHGTTVYQATIVSESTSEDAARSFFDGLAVLP